MKLILVANWKNHPSRVSEATSILDGMSRRSKIYKKLMTFVAPPTTYLELVSRRIERFGVLASQDITFPLGGTHTGEVTLDILKNFGVELAILGHSERRALGETNQVVAEKVKIALKSGITPLVCVGEMVHDAEGNYFEFLSTQLKASLALIERRGEATKIVVAYEPVWAIGKRARDAMQPAELTQVVIFIKKVLTEMFGRAYADKIPVIYGGSVEATNAKELVKTTGINGFLVGHASLDAKSFGAIALALSNK